MMFVLGIKCCCFDTAKHVREDTLHIHKFLGTSVFSIIFFYLDLYLGICFFTNSVLAMITGILNRQNMNERIENNVGNLSYQRTVVCTLTN